MATNSSGARSPLTVGDRSFDIYRLDSVPGADGLPFALKVLLENLLRHQDGVDVTSEDVAALAAFGTDTARAEREISFMPARVLLQDLTGVPCVVDIAAMRDAIGGLGGVIDRVNPLIPAELVVDHSVIVDHFGRPDAFRSNTELEFQRNGERYRFLRWGQTAFQNMTVVPPETGICHQVNLEYLSRVVFTAGGLAYPDTLVGADSHTPMVNGLGVVGWGVGGIEAEAAMLGQPISMLIPSVVGVRLHGELAEAATATDLVLTVTELLRRHGVVGKFVEFYGPGCSTVPVENRATIGNMSPEYGSTITIFPIDDATLAYLTFTGRAPEQVALVEAYAKAQGMWFDPAATPRFTETIELDLTTVQPSLAGPSRPQDRVPLAASKPMFAIAVRDQIPELAPDPVDEAAVESFPASDPPAAPPGADSWPRRPIDISIDGRPVTIDHGHVVIAAITSCTNTSNPSVMLAAGLLARNAVDRGLAAQPWVKTSLAPGSKVVTEYFDRAGLTPYLEKLGFHLVGYGCTTCIGNSGPLIPAVGDAVLDHGLAVVSVLSGNRNFEGRVNGDVRMNYLASPPLVVAYALAGTMDIDLYTEPLGTGSDGSPVFLRDIWPSGAEVSELLRSSITSEMFRSTYADVLSGDEVWRSLDTPEGATYEWDSSSTYIRQPPYFEGISAAPPAIEPVIGARVLAVFGDSVTTDHISPAGTIRPDSPAARWLNENGVGAGDLHSYGARRGNHEVMIRGTFANPRIRNRLAGDVAGGVTCHLPSGDMASIYDAAVRYAAEGTPLLILAGKEYGTGSSRDWAAKGTMLLGVRAVIAESFERIHRSNLIGMGVIPLQFLPDESAVSLGLAGTEIYAIPGLTSYSGPGGTLEVVGGDTRFSALVRIDTPKEMDYFRHGGILPYVLRQLAAGS